MQNVSRMDPLAVASNVYKSLFESDRVRVLEVIYKPGDTARMHYHPATVNYVLKGGKLKTTSDGKAEERDLTQGSVLFLEALNHESTNIGNSDINLLIIELKK